MHSVSIGQHNAGRELRWVQTSWASVLLSFKIGKEDKCLYPIFFSPLFFWKKNGDLYYFYRYESSKSHKHQLSFNLSEIQCNFNQIAAGFFMYLDKLILKLIWKSKTVRTAKIFLRKKSKGYVCPTRFTISL